MHHVRRFIVFAALLLAITGGLAPAAALAQEATPAAGACLAPELPPGTPTPLDEMAGMEASPAADDMAEMEMATPEMGEDAAAAMPEATPMLPAGTPADDETAARVTAAIENAIGCYNAGEYLALGALFTPDGLLTEFGTPNPYDLPLFLEGGPPLTVEAISDVQTHDDGRFSADVVASFGTQLQHERWFLVEAGEFLLVDETPDLPVDLPEGATVVEVQMVDFAFELSQPSAPAGPIAFRVTNVGEYPHELVLFRLPEGATVEQILTGEVAEEDVEFFGATFSEGGQPAPDLAFSDLEPGVYTMVCFVDVPEGIPHVARGMVAQFTVE